MIILYCIWFTKQLFLKLFNLNYVNKEEQECVEKLYITGSNVQLKKKLKLASTYFPLAGMFIGIKPIPMAIIINTKIVILNFIGKDFKVFVLFMFYSSVI